MTRPRRRRSGAALLVAALAGSIALLTAPARADYVWVSGELAQRRLATASVGVLPGGMAIRDDNALIVSTPRNCPWCGDADGYLHLIPPGPARRIDAATRFGSEPLDVNAMITVGSRLFASSTTARDCPNTSGIACSWPLLRLDASTGDVIGRHGFWRGSPMNTLASDPLTGRLAFLRFTNENSTAISVVLYDPDRRRSSVLFDATARRFIDEIAFSPDGGIVWISCDRNLVCGYDRSGSRRHTIQTAGTRECCRPGQDPGSFVYGRPGTALAGALLFVDGLGSVFAVERPQQPDPQVVPLTAAPNDPATDPVSGNALLDRKGDLIANQGRAIMCVGVCPVDRTVDPGDVTRPRAGADGTAPRTAGSSGGAPSQSAPVASGGGGGAASSAQTSTASQAAHQSATHAASQGATAPHAAGLADASHDDPALSFPASLLGGWTPGPWQAAGAAVVVAMALGSAAAVLPARGGEPVLARRRLG